MLDLYDWSTYAPWLRFRREVAGLTQQGLAKQLDLTESMVQSLERGRRVPSMGAFLELCRALSITPTQFFGNNP